MSAFLAVDFDYKKGLLIHMDLFQNGSDFGNTDTGPPGSPNIIRSIVFFLQLPHNANYFCKYMLCVCVSMCVCVMVPLGLSLFFIILTSIQN